MTPEEALTAAAQSAAASATLSWQQQPQNSITSAGSTNSSNSSGAKDDDSSYSAVGGDSSSSNSCNCDITGDNSTLHGFGVGDVSSFLGDDDCEGGDDDDHPDNPDAVDHNSRALRTAIIVEAKQQVSAVEAGNSDSESFSEKHQEAAGDPDADIRIIACAAYSGKDEDVGGVDDNLDVIVRRNTRSIRPSINRTFRITEEDDDDNNHEVEEIEFDEDEPEGTTIDIDEQEQLAQQQEQYNEQEQEDDKEFVGGDDDEAYEYYEEEEDDTQALSPFYTSSAELIENFGGAGKFFNIMEFERSATSGGTFTPNGNGGAGLGDLSHSLNPQADLGGGTNIMGKLSLTYYINCLTTHIINFVYRYRHNGHCKHSGNNEWYHNWT